MLQGVSFGRSLICKKKKCGRNEDVLLRMYFPLHFKHKSMCIIYNILLLVYHLLSDNVCSDRKEKHFQRGGRVKQGSSGGAGLWPEKLLVVQTAARTVRSTLPHTRQSTPRTRGGVLAPVHADFCHRLERHPSGPGLTLDLLPLLPPCPVLTRGRGPLFTNSLTQFKHAAWSY